MQQFAFPPPPPPPLASTDQRACYYLVASKPTKYSNLIDNRLRNRFDYDEITNIIFYRKRITMQITW